MKISVIIATYNRRDYVLKAVRSVQEQTLPPHEIIIVVDGSTDGTADAVKAAYPQIRIIQQPNLGRAVAANTGIAHASGEWVAFLDDDDLWHREKLAVTRDYARANPECLAINNPIWFFGDSGSAEHAFGFRRDFVAESLEQCHQAVAGGDPSRNDFSYLEIKDESFRKLLERNRGSLSSSVVHRQTLIRAGCLSPMHAYSDDWAMFVNVARLTEWHTIPRRLGFNRIHSGQSTNDAVNSLFILAGLVNSWFGGRPMPHRVRGAEFLQDLAAYAPDYRGLVQRALWLAIFSGDIRMASRIRAFGRLLLPAPRRPHLHHLATAGDLAMGTVHFRNAQVTATVIIVTLNRPDCVRKCLECLCIQHPRPDQVIVVDASADSRTKDVVEAFADVEYVRNHNGVGRMTASRNIGLRMATGELIAFVDDDAFAHEGWLRGLLEAYDNPTVGAVGGRALNNQPDEETTGVDRIGKLSPNGKLDGYFAADPGRIIEVDHIIGCNMSFRREVLAKLGGFRTDYPGISGVREDSDMCIRVKRLGYQILFNPMAAVDHIGAPQAMGRRFDWKYVYYAQRNHTVLLLRNFGLAAPIAWRGLIIGSALPVLELLKRIASALIRFGVAIAGTLVGVVSGVRLLIATGRDPVRRDPEGEAIREALSKPPKMVTAEAVAK